MLLAIDTATTTASLAVYDWENDLLLAEATWQARRRHTQDLLPAADHLLRQLGLSPAQFDALAVTTGPGSFTGVRVAISAVKGIGLGLPKRPRLVGLPTLTVTAAPWFELARRIEPPCAVCAVLQAGRGRYNWVQFADVDPLWRPTAADHGVGEAQELVQVLAVSAAPVWLVGEIDAELRAVVETLPHAVPIEPMAGLRRAGMLARLAARCLAAGVEDGLDGLQPLYLRAP